MPTSPLSARSGHSLEIASVYSLGSNVPLQVPDYNGFGEPLPAMWSFVNATTNRAGRSLSQINFKSRQTPQEPGEMPKKW